MTGPSASAEPFVDRSPEGEVTRRNILEVAEREFAAKGLAGARVDEIAEKTNSSKRMIYYYFGGKEQLYRAVLEEAYARIREREASADFESLAPDVALRQHVVHTFDYHARHPEFVRLVMNENMHLGAHIASVPGLKERNRSVIASLRAILDKGVAAGLFRRGLDPLDLHMLVSALCFYNVANRHTFAANFGVDTAEPATAKHRRDVVVDTILRYVKN